jgi:hypothetical protein
MHYFNPCACECATDIYPAEDDRIIPNEQIRYPCTRVARNTGAEDRIDDEHPKIFLL